MTELGTLTDDSVAAKLEEEEEEEEGIPGWQANVTLMKLLNCIGGLYSSLVTIEVGYVTKYLSVLYSRQPAAGEM